MAEKKRKTPMLIKGMIVVLIVAGIVLGATIGLRFLEKKQQKPRVVKALAALAADLNDDKFSVDKLYQLLKEGKTKNSGEFNIGTIDMDMLGQYEKLGKLLKNATIDFMIERDNEEKKLRAEISYQAYGVNMANMEGFIDEKECFLKLPEVYEKYLRFETENIKSQYEKSLLYTILGEKIPLPEEEFSLYPFSEMELVDVEAEKNDILGFLKENAAVLTDLYKKMEITKLSQKTDILFQGRYESCTAYELYMPTEFLKTLLAKSLGNIYGEQFIWQDDIFHGIIYLNSKNQVLKLEGEGNIKIREEEVFVTAALYPKGEENQWDMIQLDFTLTQKSTGKSGSFIVIMSNQFKENVRNTHLQFKISQPYTATFLDVDFIYYQQTGECEAEFDLETPILSLDGTYQLQDLDEIIQMPNRDDSVEIFKLSLLDLLQFVTKLNLKIFGE